MPLRASDRLALHQLQGWLGDNPGFVPGANAMAGTNVTLYHYSTRRETAAQASASYAAPDQDDCDMIEITPPRASRSRAQSYPLRGICSIPCSRGIREPRAALDRSAPRRVRGNRRFAPFHRSLRNSRTAGCTRARGSPRFQFIARSTPLIDVGVVHRLESKNAYFACHNAHRRG